MLDFVFVQYYSMICRPSDHTVFFGFFLLRPHNPWAVVRWEETGLPQLSSVLSLDSLVGRVLEEASSTRPAMKSVAKPTPPILCDKELVAEVRILFAYFR